MAQICVQKCVKIAAGCILLPDLCECKNVNWRNSTSFTHPHAIPNLYDFFCVGYKRRYFAECSSHYVFCALLSLHDFHALLIHSLSLPLALYLWVVPLLRYWVVHSYLLLTAALPLGPSYSRALATSCTAPQHHWPCMCVCLSNPPVLLV